MADISGYLQNIRNGARGEDVRDSIINALDKINKDNPSIIRPLNVTANGTYAGEGGVVYNPVTVNVPEGASQALSLTDINITENGEYEPDDGCAYRNITVEVPQYVNEILQDFKVIEYDGSGDQKVYALDDGYDGYACVQVIAGGGGGGGGQTFKVDFMSADGGTLLEEVAGVPYGGGAVYHKPTPTSPGMRFVGWSPNPLKVTSNMVCRARFENAVYDPTQITDDWVTIAKNCEADPDHYNIGQWKVLELTGYDGGQAFPYELWDDVTKTAFREASGAGSGGVIDGPNTRLYMQLVAKGVDRNEGENGYANTTWVCKFPACIRLVQNGQAHLTGLQFKAGNDFTHPNSWPENPAKGFLSGQFTTELFPKELIRYIKRVIKYTSTYDHTEAGMYDQNLKTIDWFFPLSAREIMGNVPDLSFSSVIEQDGPCYYSYNSYADFKADWCAKANEYRSIYGDLLSSYIAQTRSSWTGSQTYPNGIIAMSAVIADRTVVDLLLQRADDRGADRNFMLGFCI